MTRIFPRGQCPLAQPCLSCPQRLCARLRSACATARASQRACASAHHCATSSAAARCNKPLHAKTRIFARLRSCTLMARLWTYACIRALARASELVRAACAHVHFGTRSRALLHSAPLRACARFSVSVRATAHFFEHRASSHLCARPRDTLRPLPMSANICAPRHAVPRSRVSARPCALRAAERYVDDFARLLRMCAPLPPLRCLCARAFPRAAACMCASARRCASLRVSAFRAPLRNCGPSVHLRDRAGLCTIARLRAPAGLCAFLRPIPPARLF